MDGYKEFQGKSLDDAIREACSYFDAPREKLEIDIVQDAKSGIFGIVGARKAKIRARRAQIGRLAPSASPAGGSRQEAVAPGADAMDASPAGQPRDERAAATAGTAGAEAADGADAPEVRPARASRPREDRPREDRSREDRPRRDRGEAAPVMADALDDSRDDADSGDEDDERRPEGERSGRRRRRGGRGRRDRDGEARGEQADRPGQAREGDGQAAEGGAPQESRPPDESRPGGRPARSPRPQPPRPQSPQRGPRPARQTQEDEGNGQPDQPGRRGGPRRNGERPDRSDRPERPERASADADMLDDADEHGGDGLPEIPLEQLDQEQVKQVAVEVMERLVTPVIGEAGFSVELAEGRVNVSVDCGENSGLLIGREGQTLSALQYLASRIVSRKLGASVRVQLDSGDYRERQDDKLRDIALHLAEKVRATGKPQSTRPLSSYHRRVVHVTLQDDEEVVTRSKGDGPLKRVIIMRKKKS
ncbi:Jag N-terminal domain-containing protein [Nitratidesulfovibrio sp. 1201_IL3209]|uniref:Jag N-terminal domain-containing protein n=1 Tax=Nitratidesulfovibrio sp. 1201_IL3209 TaxID=3084053 RepID=UPI002FD8DA16